MRIKMCLSSKNDIHEPQVKSHHRGPESGAYAQIWQADPTQRKTYLHWLADRFLNNALLLEDLPKATAYLAAFHRHKNNLPNTSDGQSGKKIDSYSRLPQLYRAVAPYLPEEAQDPEQEADADAAPDIIELFHHNHLRVVIPLSTAAATREGRGTQWCTAYGTAPNHFWNYACQGPLLIVHTPDETGKPRKYQLHFPSDQFHDEADEKINLVELTRNRPELWPILEPYAQAAVAQNGEALESVPEKLLSEAMCLTAVTQNGAALQYVPKELRIETMCLTAVTQNGEALQYVPEELRSEALCLTAVAQNGRALYCVSKELRTPALCKTAVAQNGEALAVVPKELRIEALCLTAVTQNGAALQYVPKELRIETMCLTAVTQNGEALQYVPEELRIEAMCLTAVAQNGRALYCVSKELRTPALCKTAVAQNGEALAVVPKELRIEAICKAAVTQNGQALRAVPKKLRTPALCLAAVMQNGAALLYVPEELRTDAMCLAALHSIIRAAQEKNERMRFDIFHLIPNKQQDQMAKKVGLGFDAKGFMTVAPSRPFPAPMALPGLVAHARAA
ncbi:MAG: DUF4116 domain-containing protein [Alphaproteobacteria bacterium]|nr:MAG: DUF4116 domain-containing protein [Alphaproteobacteria bacterium]